MSKVFTYVILSIGMLLILNMMGIPTAASSILSWVGLANPNQAIDTSLFFTAIAAVFAASAVVGIIVGFLTRASPESYIAATLCGGLIVFVGTFTSIINYTNAATGNDWASKIIFVIMAPIAIGYGISLVSYWRGAD